jgi:hypothetical protein
MVPISSVLTAQGILGWAQRISSIYILNFVLRETCAMPTPPHPTPRSPPIDQPLEFFLLSMNEQRPFVSNSSTIVEPCFVQVRRVEPFSLIYVKVYPSLSKFIRVYPSLSKRKTGLQTLLRLWRRPSPHGSSSIGLFIILAISHQDDCQGEVLATRS